MVTQKKIAKSVKDKKSTVKSKKGEKPKFDIYAPVFKTKMKYVYGWLDYMNKTYEDPNDDWLDWEEYMVWAPWLRDEKFYRVNNIPWTLLSAHERVMMGIYNPETKKSKDDGDKP